MSKPRTRTWHLSVKLASLNLRAARWRRSGRLTSILKTHFDGINTSIHGIDEDVVAGSPTFAMLADTLISRLSGRIIVTHTAFDRVALHRAGTKHKTPPLSGTWLDTACVARRAWTEFSRSGYATVMVSASLRMATKMPAGHSRSAP